MNIDSPRSDPLANQCALRRICRLQTTRYAEPPAPHLASSIDRVGHAGEVHELLLTDVVLDHHQADSRVRPQTAHTSQPVPT